MSEHQEHSVWNNYSWQPASRENENEAPQDFPASRPPIFLEDDWEDAEFDEEDLYDDFYEETGIAD